MHKLLNGKKLSQKILDNLKEEIAKSKTKPGLAVILVGNDVASKVYVKNKEAACEAVGINSYIYRLPQATSTEKLIELIALLNKNKKVNGILVQFPLPKKINKDEVIAAIDPKKDVDCFHPTNIGKLLSGQQSVLPCTPAGVIEILKANKIRIAGKHAVIVGRSNIVGRPLAQMLLNEDATVTICHSRTAKLANFTRQADILIAAVGSAKLIKKNMVKKGAVVIDVGINRDESGKLCGDVDFENVKKVAKSITPVPGGVGPMTIAMLLVNCFEASQAQD